MPELKRSSSKLSGLVCRPALAQDKPGMQALTAEIWEGHDYLPRVWDEWLLDATGRLVVAEVKGRLVGLGKLTFLAPGQWWVEGLRVHPEFEGLGIASHLHEYLLKAWEKLGYGVLRLATSAKKLPIHHLCSRTGFEKVAEFTSFRADALPEPVDCFAPLASTKIDQVLEMAVSSPSMRYSGGYWDLGWEWAAPTPEFLADASAQGLAFGWRGERGFLVLRIDEDEDDPQSPMPWLQIMACGLEDVAGLLKDYRRLTAQLGFRQAGWMAGMAPDLYAALNAAGFERTWESSLFIFEKKSMV
jgi:GNAT superfamily N-acetyltransferase